MLKIKDEVDLKELEKFGFKRDQDHNIVFYTKDKIYDDNMTHSDLIVYDKDRIIKTNLYKKEILSYPGFDINLDNTIYDLIKAGLVEKIEE